MKMFEFSFITISFFILGGAAGNFALNVPSNSNGRYPMVLKHNRIFELSETNATLNLNENEDIPLVCPNKNDVVVLSRNDESDESSVHVRCISNDFISNDFFKPHLREEIPECQNPNLQNYYTVSRTSLGCMNDYLAARLYYIGITNSCGTDEDPLIKVCFDEESRTSFWSRHILRSLKKNNGCQGSKYRGCYYNDKYFKNAGLVYKGHGQEWSKGQLVPVDDFDTEIDRLMTYSYINTFPHTTAFSKRMWRFVETFLKKQVDYLGNELEVYTGLCMGDDTLTQIGDTITEKPIPIPASLWKLVINWDQQKAVVFLGANIDMGGVCQIEEEEYDFNCDANDAVYKEKLKENTGKTTNYINKWVVNSNNNETKPEDNNIDKKFKSFHEMGGFLGICDECSKINLFTSSSDCEENNSVFCCTVKDFISVTDVWSACESAVVMQPYADWDLLTFEDI